MSAIDLKGLQDKFAPGDIEWRIGRSGKSDKGFWATALAYLTNRAIQQRLDDVCGPENWQNEYRPGPSGGVVCGISIWDGHRAHWVTKWDGAENTDFESVKGGLSDSMKRAAVQWGIGRYLYNLDETFVSCSEARKPGWNYAQTKEKLPFYWQTPELPSWALPDGKKAAPKPKVVPADDRASAAELAEIGRLCQETGTDFRQLSDFFKVEGHVTKAQAASMVASLKKKLSKQVDTSPQP